MAEATARGRDGLGLRLLTATIGLPVVFGALWIGGPVLLTLGIVVALLGLLEFRSLMAPLGNLSTLVAGAGSIGFMVMAWRGDPLPAAMLAALVTGGLVWHMIRHIGSRATSGPNVLGGWALTVAGAVYPAGLLAYGLAVYGLSDGREWLLIAVALTFTSDTAAYATGRALGRHKLAPRLSPGKTWEGAIGAIMATGLAGAGLTAVFDLDVSPLVAVGLGVVVSISAQAGDLAESFLKRQGNTKEAGSLLPGHGGMLDRLDSIVFVLPAVYYGLVWVI